MAPTRASEPAPKTLEKFFARVRPVLEARLSAAITATASAFIGAWEQAGRPTVALEGVRPVEKVRRPQP